MTSPMTLRYEVFGEDIIDRELVRFSEHAADPAPAFFTITETMREETAKQFESEGSYASGGWAALNEDYLASKIARGLNPMILHATNVLVESLVNPDSSEQIFEADRTGFVYGSRVFYGKFHQTGTANMPQRRPIDFTEIAKRGFTKELQRYLIGGAAGASVSGL